MALQKELIKQGKWLFRWRSYLPFIMIIPFAVFLSHNKHPFSTASNDDLWGMICFLISLTGNGIRLFTVGYTPKGTSGSNTRNQVANSLNTLGMYSIVRHPLYLGNFLIWMGFSACFQSWWLSLVVALVFWLYYERIMLAEEAYLREKFGKLFSEWAENTPAIVPNFRLWKPWPSSFSFKKAIRREYSAISATVLAFSIFHMIKHWLAIHMLKSLWVALFAFGVMFYVIVRYLKKSTTVLEPS